MIKRLRPGQTWQIEGFLGYHSFMRLAILLVVVFSVALPSAASASFSTSQTIGKPGDAPDIQDAVSEVGYGRSDGAASQAELYFPAQLLPDGDRLLFTEYNSILRPRYYKLGGALRAVSPEGEIATLALSKKMALTADRMTGLAASGGIAYTTLGESVISLPLPDRRSDAERTLGFPSHGGMRETLSAYTLGSAELPYDTLAGDAVQSGYRNGVGQEARFSYPYALSLYENQLLVADRDNDAVRRIDLGSGRTYDMLGGINAPVGLAQVSGRLYVAASRGLWSIDPAACLSSNPSGCRPNLLPVQGGVSALAARGSSLVLVSPSGVFAYDTASGSLSKLSGPSAATQSIGGAAFWRGRLYLSDFGSRVIRAYKVKMPSPVRAEVKSELTQDGVVLTPRLTGTVVYSPSFTWKISAPGCSVSERGSSRLVTCPTPSVGQVSLSFSGPGVAGGSVERQVKFR